MDADKITDIQVKTKADAKEKKQKVNSSTKQSVNKEPSKAT
jgi:hypothetical protein